MKVEAVKVPLPPRIALDGEEGEGEIDPDSPDFVALDKLRRLEHNTTVRELLGCKELKEMIERCNRADDKNEEISSLMKSDLFVQFANACLETVEGDDCISSC